MYIKLGINSKIIITASSELGFYIKINYVKVLWNLIFYCPRERYDFFFDGPIESISWTMLDIIEEAMTNDMPDEQINFMHDCSRSVIEELWLFREMIVTNFKVRGSMKKL